MRLEGASRRISALAALAVAAAIAPAGSLALPLAAPDSMAGPAAASDSTSAPLPPRPAELLPFRPGSSRNGAVPRDTFPTGAGAGGRVGAIRIDLADARMRGVVTLAEALRASRPMLLDPLPVYGPSLGSVKLPDGSAPYRTEERWLAAGGATDRPLLRLGRYGGIAGLAATLEDPEGTGLDVLDLLELSTPDRPAPAGGPSDAISFLEPRTDADPLARPGVPMPRRFRTTLIYRKGDGDELTTGVRFFSPTLGRGLAGSFARHAAGGTATISRAVSSRYRVDAALPRAMGHTLSVEGRLLQRTLDMSLPETGAEARAEMERSSLAFRAAARSEYRRDGITVTLRRVKRTDVPLTGAPRERWEFPEFRVQGDAAWGDSLGGSVSAGLAAATTRVSHRMDSTPDVSRRLSSARIRLGTLRPLGPGGVGADVTYDVTGGQSAEWDARASGWAAGRTAAVRVDLESAHQRPTWIDLWTPYRADTIATDTGGLVYARAGDSSLRARRQTGAAAFAALDAGPTLRLMASGGVHHVTRDFGWDVASDTAAVPWAFTEKASKRGDGWISFASLACAASAGPLSGRAVGWLRWGDVNQSPTAGSPPRRALDASAGIRRPLFGGDLLARLSAAAHVVGPRRGLIREPAEALWDGMLELDFGAAGAVLALNNVFDRRAGSGVLDVETGRAVPLPGRTFHFGIVWNLLN
jgi:hypothetical protein